MWISHEQTDMMLLGYKKFSLDRHLPQPWCVFLECSMSGPRLSIQMAREAQKTQIRPWMKRVDQQICTNDNPSSSGINWGIHAKMLMVLAFLPLTPALTSPLFSHQQQMASDSGAPPIPCCILLRDPENLPCGKLFPAGSSPWWRLIGPYFLQTDTSPILQFHGH